MDKDHIPSFSNTCKAIYLFSRHHLILCLMYYSIRLAKKLEDWKRRLDQYA